RVAELSARPVEQEKRTLWIKHNDLMPVRPLVFCDPENGWQEIITPDQIECRHELARAWEHILRKEIFWGEQMGDDRVIEPWFNVGCVYTRSDWGIHETNIGGDHGGARRWEAPVRDISDLDRLRFQSIELDGPATERLMGIAQDTLGDLLPVRIRNTWYWTLGMTWELIKLRGLEQIMMDMYDNPELLHRLMAFLRDGTLHMLDVLEQEGLYTLNNEGDYVGSGGFGWTTQLPASDFADQVRTKDLWCLLESQETVGISPQMFEEFVFRYQVPVMERFGRVCYGCCEPIHDRWHLLKNIPNLRRISVSPWCDRALMAENLGDRYVYSLKPHPVLLAGVRFEPEAVRADVRDALEKAKGCRLEIIMKDNHTIGNDPRRVVDWCNIVRQEIDRG
ncbi:MAG: hypothetical protein JW808_01865, partial [Victivallales bacterium]|nr:hypothetical protein [Victivallales bacterium]